MLRLTAWLLPAMALSVMPRYASSQSPVSASASVFLAADHWAAKAAERALTSRRSALGLSWTYASITRREVAEILRAAADSAEQLAPQDAGVARNLWRRFVEEFPSTAASLEGTAAPRRQFGETSLRIGADSRANAFVPGFAEWLQFGGTGPVRVPAGGDAVVDLTWAGSLTSYFAAELSPRHLGGDWAKSEAYGLLDLPLVRVWLGRRSFAYGPGEGGGLILNASTPLTGGGILLGPSPLPWLLRYLGPVRFEGNLSRLDSSFAVKHPWLMVNHGSFSPHPRLLLGLTHGAIFAGSGRPPFNARNFFAMVLLGRATKGSAEAEFENQLVAGEIRWRPPVRSLPLELHVAWGTEDNQGAWYEVPASQFGAHVAAVPGLPELSVGAERTEFEPPCAECGNQGFGSNWYRHYIYKAGWTVDQHLLGHPLGGNGVEWLAWAHADLHDARLRLDARAYYRERGPYNLFSPDLQGYGHGGALNVAWRLRANAEAQASFEAERLGNDDLRRAGFVGARIFF